MKNYFYSHLVPIDNTVSILDSYNLSDVEKLELEQLLHSIFHHRVLDIILVELPIEAHDELIKRIANNPSDLDIMVFIKTHSPDIEEKIQECGNNTLLEITTLINDQFNHQN